MQLHRFSSAFLGLAVLASTMLLSNTAQAQDTSSVNAAFQVARNSVPAAQQTQVVSVYGLGTPDAIQKWYFIFYDPTVTSHGHSVLVENGQVTKSFEAKGGVTYSAKLTFDPARITSEQPALNAAQNYATKHNIAYDSVRALLKVSSHSKPFRWRIELMSSGQGRGYVYVNAIDDTVASYSSPDSDKGHGTGSVGTDAQDFGNDVKSTFLGIGGDLQQFFTGERTVDR